MRRLCGWLLSAMTSVAPVTAAANEPPQSRYDGMKRSVRQFTARIAPNATAAQATNWGLLLPQRIDPNRPIVVLLHGLDADRADCMPMGQLLAAAGFQVAYFGYPGDEPIDESAAMFAREMRALRLRYPRTVIDIVAHSMGGLVARDYMEGGDYAGGIDHLVLIGTPNHGSSWARFRMLLAIQQNYREYKTNPQWRATWMITEGLGEAGEDLMPDSRFLKRLNDRPRRAGVRYTIIAGSKNGVNRYEAYCVAKVDGWIPDRSRHWWGLRNLDAFLHRKAHRLLEEIDDNDGPVSLRSARLAGVNDFLVLPADHATLFFPIDGAPPAALRVVKNRLSR